MGGGGLVSPYYILYRDIENCVHWTRHKDLSAIDTVAYAQPSYSRLARYFTKFAELEKCSILVLVRIQLLRHTRTFLRKLSEIRNTFTDLANFWKTSTVDIVFREN